MKKGRFYFMGILFLFLIILISIVVSSVFKLSNRKARYVEIKFKPIGIKAIEVEDIKNIIEKEKISLMGIGIGLGIASPQIYTYSFEKFMEVIPLGKPIYVTLKTSDPICPSDPTSFHPFTDELYPTVLKRTYWSLSEGKVITYEENYRHQENDHVFWIIGYDYEKVKFYYKPFYYDKIVISCALLFPLIALLISSFTAPNVKS